MEINDTRDRRPRRQGALVKATSRTVPYGRSDLLCVCLAGWPRPVSVRTGFDPWIEKIDGPGSLFRCEGPSGSGGTGELVQEVRSASAVDRPVDPRDLGNVVRCPKCIVNP